MDQIHIHREATAPLLRPAQTDPHSTSRAQQREEQLLQALSQFEKPYVSRSFARLSDTVNQLFVAPSKGLPREDEVLSLVKLITRLGSLSMCVCILYYCCVCCSHSELSVAGNCTPLASILGQNASKTVQLFNAKCEQLVCPSVYLPIYNYRCLFVCLSICLFVCLSICLFVCLSAIM